MRMLPDRWEGKSKVSGMYSLKSIGEMNVEPSISPGCGVLL